MGRHPFEFVEAFLISRMSGLAGVILRMYRRNQAKLYGVCHSELLFVHAGFAG